MKYAIGLVLSLLYCFGNAQDTKLVDSIAFYGKLRAHTAVFDGDIELQPNSPRIDV